MARELWFPGQGSNPSPCIRSTGSEQLDYQGRPQKVIKNDTHTKKKTSQALNAINRSTSGSDTLGWENEQGNPRSKRGLVLFFPKEHILLNQAEKDIQNGIL